MGHNPTMTDGNPLDLPYRVEQYNTGDTDTGADPDETWHCRTASDAVDKAQELAEQRYKPDEIRARTDEYLPANCVLGLYEPGQPGNVLVIDTETAHEGPDDYVPFGESIDDRAEAAFYVRRNLKEYLNVDEVFEFRFMEPTHDAATTEPYPTVSYYITSESRNGIPGLKGNPAYSRKAVPLEWVPDEILARAKAMVAFANEGLEVDDE